MPNTLFQKLKRLRAMSLPEVCYRVQVHIKNKIEKSRIVTGKVESLESFFVRLPGDGSTMEEKFESVHATLKKRKFFEWENTPREKLLKLYTDHFTGHIETVVAAADEIIDLKFEIFGHPVHFAEKIDWFFDPLQHKSVPVDYWSDINYYDSRIVKEIKFVWELNRCQHFVTLGKAYFLTGDEKYAAALLGQWNHWIDKNPYKMGINWTSSLECAFRLVSWTWALAFVRQSGHWHAGFTAKVLQSVQQHARFIAGHLSKYSSANNHVLGEALGLIYAGCYFPECVESEYWRTKGFRLFFNEITRQVHADGVSAEQSTFYAKYIFDFMVLAFQAAKKANRPVPQVVHERLEKMADFYAAILDDSGNIPHFGDDDGGCVLRLTEGATNPYRELLSTAAAYFKRPDFKCAAGDFSEASFWLLGESSVQDFLRLPLQKDERQLIHFPEGGYVVLKQSRPCAQKLVFDCGPLGLGAMAAHGHADALSFTLSVAGQPVLIDCGTFMYLGAGTERDYFRSTRAHNTLTVDSRNQSEMLGPFQWGRRARVKCERVHEEQDQLLISASHNGYRDKKITHRRTVEARDGNWIIKDLISGVGNHQIDVYFHYLSSKSEQRARTVVADYSTCQVEFQFDEHGRTRKDIVGIEEAWHSLRFGQREKHGVIRRTVFGPLPLELTTKIIVYA